MPDLLKKGKKEEKLDIQFSQHILEVNVPEAQSVSKLCSWLTLMKKVKNTNNFTPISDALLSDWYVIKYSLKQTTNDISAMDNDKWIRQF